MIQWKDVLRYAEKGNLPPDRTIQKTDAEWKAQLTDEEYRVTRQKGTERAFSNDMCSLFEPGLYECVCCATLLFDANTKFESGSGWPSFTQPIQDNVIAYHLDNSYGMSRVETTCNTCGAHLGHVFPDGPEPSGLRYCMNAVALKKRSAENTMLATFGGGCFWCTEAVFLQLKGVVKVESGYSGGKVAFPSYKEVCEGNTGHAEAIQISYNPAEISYRDLLIIHLTTHDPTQMNRQGADVGTQYRSVIFYRNETERTTALEVIAEFNEALDHKVVTEVVPFEHFYKAEDYHQNYYAQNQNSNSYCSAVISPKLEKFRKLFKDRLKTT